MRSVKYHMHGDNWQVHLFGILKDMNSTRWIINIIRYEIIIPNIIRGTIDDRKRSTKSHA